MISSPGNTASVSADHSDIIRKAYFAIRHLLDMYEYSFTRSLFIVPGLKAGDELLDAFEMTAKMFLGDKAGRIHCLHVRPSSLNRLEAFLAPDDDIHVLIVSAKALADRKTDPERSGYLFRHSVLLAELSPIEILRKYSPWVILCNEQNSGAGVKAWETVDTLDPVMTWKFRCGDDPQAEALLPFDTSEAFRRLSSDELSKRGEDWTAMDINLDDAPF
ncbi:MAG: hypothetical protein JW989_09280 [Chlorobiaceae bacterium]|jgi:hypothetical protein|nr:hypothetical protein [Chlorobiaceae bacterium]